QHHRRGPNPRRRGRFYHRGQAWICCPQAAPPRWDVISRRAPAPAACVMTCRKGELERCWVAPTVTRRAMQTGPICVAMEIARDKPRQILVTALGRLSLPTPFFGRLRYSPLGVSTATVSPILTKGGTVIFKPVSKVAGLYCAAAVAPLTDGSV